MAPVYVASGDPMAGSFDQTVKRSFMSDSCSEYPKRINSAAIAFSS